MLFFIKAHVASKGITYSLIYIKSKQRGSKWQAIICTDKHITAQKAYNLYQTRWAIEVACEKLKQIFDYGKCQSRYLDVQLADTTQCLLADNLHSHNKAINDYQSIDSTLEIVQSTLTKTHNDAKIKGSHL